MNLFLDFSGGSMVQVRNINGQWVIERDEEGREIRTGGLLPRISPGHLQLGHLERYAATCDIVADWIDAASSNPPSSKQAGELWKPAAKAVEWLNERDIAVNLPTVTRWADVKPPPFGVRRRRRGFDVEVFSLVAHYLVIRRMPIVDDRLGIEQRKAELKRAKEAMFDRRR